jgi:hypothetical protein
VKDTALLSLLLPHGCESPRDIAQAVSNFNFLPCLDGELESLWCLEHQDDRAAKIETSHFLGRGQRLAIEEWGRGGVDGFGVGPRRGWATTDVGTECLNLGVSPNVLEENQRFSYGVKVDVDATDVRRADGYHAEETISPSSKECNPFVKYK